MSGYLVARQISHGGIAGAVVACVAGVGLVLLALPFILRYFRNSQTRRSVPAHSNAEMGMFRPPGPPETGGPPVTVGPPGSYGPGPSGPAPFGYPSPPMGSPTPPPFYGGQYVENGKPYGAPSPHTRAVLPPGPAMTGNGHPPVSYVPQQQHPPPSMYPPPSGAPRPRTSTMRSSGASSLTQAIATIFRQGSNHSGANRSPVAAGPPAANTRSPNEYGYSEYDASNSQLWMMTDHPGGPGLGYSNGTGGYPHQMQDPSAMGNYVTVPPGTYDSGQQYLTGASAEYYSGAPLSPPSDPNSPAAPGSYVPTPPPAAPTSSSASPAVVASGSKTIKPVPMPMRTDSLRTATTSTDFSPLSPTSPPLKLQDTFTRTEELGIVAEQEPIARGSLSASPASFKTALTPEPVDYRAVSPSFRPLVPSPQLPAPGTVNPRDVWAPATEDERYVHVTAELDRIEQSPPPILSSIASPAAADGGAAPSDTAVALPGQPAVTPPQTTSPPVPTANITVTPPGLDYHSANGTADDFNAGNVSDYTQGTREDTDDSGVGHAHQMSMGTDFRLYPDGQSLPNVPMFAPVPAPVPAPVKIDMPMVQHADGNVYWIVPDGNVPMLTEPYTTSASQHPVPGMLLTAPTTMVPSAITTADGSPNYVPLSTPQSSPAHTTLSDGPRGQEVYLNASTAAPMPAPALAGFALVTPPPPKQLSNFNSPLSVPRSDPGPVSPLSNGGSTPGQSSSSSPRTFACDECGRMFDQVHKLNHHKRYHERPHECPVPDCGKRFGTKTHLDRHINDKHSKSRKYHCTEDGCPYSVHGGKSFPRKDNWRRHMVNKHNVHPEHDPIEVVDQPMTGL